MNRVLPYLLLLLALLPSGASAETTVGPAIDSLPYIIKKAGVFHFTKDLNYTPASGAAITVAANDVTIDLNGFVLIATSGTENSTVGVLSSGYNRITIKDGAIRGFLNGIYMSANDVTATDLQVESCLHAGITIRGNHTQIMHNRILGTGGNAGGTSVGITLGGTNGVVNDNDVQQTFVADAAGDYADGILLLSFTNMVVSNNRISDLEPAAPAQGGASTGIVAGSPGPSNNLVILGNVILSTQIGIDLSGGASGKYGDNTTGGVSTGYNTGNTGMTDIGNNN